MAFRRRRFTRRRGTRRTWDMQTFRDCERELDVVFGQGGSTCANPQTTVDFLCGVGDVSLGTQMVEGSSRAVMFGGGFLQVRYNAAFVIDSDLPCHPSVQVTTAIVKLPLQSANEIAPAYIPNLVVSRQQSSVITATKSDTDEDILWWWQDQLDLGNVVCGGLSESCWFNNNVACKDGDALVQILGTAAALYGRLGIRERVKVKRRLDERHALFLLTSYNINQTNLDTDQTWPVRRNVYLRYAVRRTR